MNNKTLAAIDSLYKKTTFEEFKTLDQCLQEFKNEIEEISNEFKIDHLQSLIFSVIISNNVINGKTRLRDIAEQLQVTNFEILKHLDLILQMKEMKIIEIIENNDVEESNSFRYRSKSPIRILNSYFAITKQTQDKIIINQ